MNWKPLLKSELSFEVNTQVMPTKGNLVYEYNPFRNYRLSQNMLEYKGDYYTQGQLEKKFGIKIGQDNNGKDIWKKGDADVSQDITLHEKGELVDFITDELSFSIKSPVTITPQYSYDGSVNLIINDGVNIPRMINSRFSATGRNTYEVVDRKGNNDTNIYDQGEQFDIDTSLYKRVVKIPKIKFNGISSGGNLKIGNYHLYIKLSDADGNETDFVGETGLISVFKGFGDPRSVTTGQANENSFKSIKLLISNIDISYNYIYIYYSRYSAEADEAFNIEYAKVDKKFIVNNSGIASIVFTGFEDIIPISASDINLNYNIIDSAHTATSCQNMLFLGNVHKPEIPYKELSDLSLHFLPYLKQENYQMHIDEKYRIDTYNRGYYDPKFIYEKTGYWGEEIYRLGIVYIMPNNELSPVFNIRGANNIQEYIPKKNTSGTTSGTTPGGKEDIGEYNDGQFSDIKVWIDDGNGNNIRNYIQYNENNYQILKGENSKLSSNPMENVKGVVRFLPSKDTNTIYGIDIRVDDDAIQELKKYVKGYFFVRQTRIPTILAQGITIGIDQTSFTPCVATADGFLNDLANQLDNTHVSTEDINDVNYISEGFLRRYTFYFKKKHSGLFGSILKGAAIGIGVVALAAAVVFAPEVVGAIAAGSSIGTAVSAGAAAVATSIGTAAGFIAGATGIGLGSLALGSAAIVTTVAAGTAATISVLGAIQEVRYSLGRTFSTKKLDGRNTQCPSGYKIVETDESRKLTQNFRDRIIIKDKSKVKVQGILCPDYEVNQGYLNSVFTGNEHMIQLTNTQCSNGLVGHTSNYFTNNERHFYVPDYYDMGIRNHYKFKIIGVADDIALTGIDDLKFRSRAGQAEEAWRYECVGDDYKSDYAKKSQTEDEETLSNKQINTDIIRGSFGPYLAFNDTQNKFSPAETVNIFIPDYSISNMMEYFNIRYQDNSPFQAISDRYDINDSDDNLITPLSVVVPKDVNRSCGYRYELYRGDCYICQFTHRMHRNFNDPSAPYNDEIVQDNTWKENYSIEEPDKFNQINLGDINAIQIGTWVTFRVRSSFNLNIRTVDGSDVTETAMVGHPKAYYPYNDMSVEGTYKHSDSQIYNKGFSKSVSERFNMELPDVPYIKNWFGTRIMYSDIHINDAYKNSYRVFRPTAYRDYTREYGEIVKLITLESNLICVFEHGVARISVNASAVAQQLQTGGGQLITQNVLPETPFIISDMYGSQWADSVLKTPGKAGDSKQYIYGVDTVAKKIWRTDGQSLECISDMRVQEFLNNNITLGERENTPILGIRNVKTCYNSFKRDVMFTFYDNTYGFEEKVWNLCWSELLDKFITFYSWVPAMMEDINNIPFSFDRNVSKWIAKLGTSHANNSFSDGITLTNTITNNYFTKDKADDKTANKAVDNYNFDFTYTCISGEKKTITYDINKKKEGYEPIPENTKGFIGVLGLANRILPDDNLFYTITYKLERDPWKNYKYFTIKQVGTIYMDQLLDSKFSKGYQYSNDPNNNLVGLEYPIYGLYFSSLNSSGYELVYDYPAVGDQYAVFTDKTNRVQILAPPTDPEILMSELYYRNAAGHAYADYDINKIKIIVDNSVNNSNTNIDPNTLYDINELMKLVTKYWYGLEDGNIIDKEKLLTRSGGPFEYDTIVYLKSKSGQHYACSGGLGSLIDKPQQHAPFDAHFMYGTYIENIIDKRQNIEDLPIFKDINGRRPMLPKKEQLNPDKIVTLLNIKANVSILDSNNINNLSDSYYNLKSSYSNNTAMINAAQYESVVAITTKWNMQFLTSDFWKHGQAGLIDIADDIYPTYWYGKQHPFEFECIVVDDPSLHKIFTNLELVANKAKPESFHYEVVGETYDFAKDKVNMYFRQEALKALWQYNGSDITYDRNFLKVQPRQQARSADLIHRYYSRKDTINDIEDYYIHVNYPKGYDYRHLSGSEIVYYPTRQEFRIWNHTMAIDLKDLSQDDARSIIAGNCEYLEDRWKVTINPIIVCYKNEYVKTSEDGYPLIHPSHSTWSKAYESSQMLPSLPIANSPVPNEVKESGQISFPGLNSNNTELDRSNALYHLYDLTNFGISTYKPLDTSSWLNDVSIYRYNFGEAHNRKEIDVRDKFVKIRIRYSGEELAIIDFLNTIYQVSYA